MIVHQGTGVASGWPNSRFTRLCRIASPSTQRRPPIVWATVRTPSWVSVVRSCVFGTSTGRVSWGEHRRRSAGVEVGGERSQVRPLVDVGDGDRRVALAQPRTRVAVARLVPPRAKKSESGSIGTASTSCQRPPASPPCRPGPRRARARGSVAGRGPRQRLPVDLARRAGREAVDERQHRHERGGQPLGEPRARGRSSSGAVVDGEVADEDLAARLGLLDRGRGRLHPGQREQRGVDLAELDPPPAELDLVVGAADEEQARAVRADEVAGVVGPRPAQRGHRRVLLGVLRRVEVAAEARARDDQLAGLARGAPACPPRPPRPAASPSSGSPIRTGLPGPAGRRTRRPSPRWARRCSTPRGPARPAARRAPAGTPRRRR